LRTPWTRIFPIHPLSFIFVERHIQGLVCRGEQP
jgi:hypothetical protein